MKTVAIIFLLLIQVGLILGALRILGTMLFLIIYHKKKLPFVPTRNSITRMMVASGYVHDNDVIVDLGCGTGTLCLGFARVFRHARCIGVERESLLATVAYLRTLRFGKRVEIIRDDMFAYTGLPQATVIVGFWITELMPQIIEKIAREARVGTVIISHMFPLPEHEHIQRVETLTKRTNVIHIYKVV